MQISTPTVIDDKTYTHYGANLIITSKYVNRNLDASVILNLIPTRFEENGEVVTNESHTRRIMLGDIQNISGPEQEAMQSIYTAVQNYINAKGL